MGQLLTIPYCRSDGMCPVNGIRDLVQWRTGRDWSLDNWKRTLLYRKIFVEFWDAKTCL